MRRRAFLAMAGGSMVAPFAAFAQHSRMVDAFPPAPPLTGQADIDLRIAEINWELAPGRIIRTTAYNGSVPGPLLRTTRGRPVTVDVWNNSREVEIVHWHGLHIPSDVDGAVEQGTPPVRPGTRRRYVFTPEPAGTRWYHTHITAGNDLRKGTYSGQFGVLIVEGGADTGAYDADVPIVLHEWDGRFTKAGDVEPRYFSVNGKMLSAGEPIRVKLGQRVLFRIVNASATLQHQIALPGHSFDVVALDGNPVPKPATVPILDLGPGERIDAIVEMNRSGVWVMGAFRNDWRNAGLGIVVEYAGAQGPARWLPPPAFTWDYGAFSMSSPAAEPDERLTMVFRMGEGGHNWMINGKSYPRTDSIDVVEGRRYRWTFDNQSAESHPIHLHRHTFEVVRVDDRSMAGVMKDVVVVPAWKQVEVDVTAAHPGLSLFHCHQQLHMDRGFMAMMRYLP